MVILKYYSCNGPDNFEFFRSAAARRERSKNRTNRIGIPPNKSGFHGFHWLSTQDCQKTRDTRMTAHLSGSSLPHFARKGEWTATWKRERMHMYYCPSRPSVVGALVHFLHAIRNKFQQQRKVDDRLTLVFHCMSVPQRAGLFSCSPQRAGLFDCSSGARL